MQVNNFRELPEFIESIDAEWCVMEVDESTPMETLTAYVRYLRAREAVFSAEEEFFHGYPVVNEDTIEHVASLIARLFKHSKDLHEQIHLMYLFRLLMPGIINWGNPDSDMEYERKNNKWLANYCLEKKIPLTADIVDLLIKVREDNKRLPAPLSQYIKTAVPAWLKTERGKISKATEEQIRRDAEALRTNHPDFDLNSTQDGLLKERTESDLNLLSQEIRLLELSIQWQVQIEPPSSLSPAQYRQVEITHNATFDSLYLSALLLPNRLTSSETTITKDKEQIDEIIKVLYEFSNMMLTCFAWSGTIEDRENFYHEIESLLQEDPSHLTLPQQLTLASMCFENFYFDHQRSDIYTAYWTLHRSLKAEEQAFHLHKRRSNSSRSSLPPDFLSNPLDYLL